ncbi:hypothetical protein QAD02_020656 [Eretmocerus hayati]|uniref:Uncharacterized protein n=1 Tax=Eretmocerus hayati TaxID=131215 RepID=A0ACC2PN28_9HYME|nr:hypothetical protein QAD02_020656 [Eretmocerus hayati]
MCSYVSYVSLNLMSDAEENRGDTPKTQQGTKYASKESVRGRRESVRKNLGEQFSDEFDLRNSLSEESETVEMTKDKSDDNSNDKTDNGDGQSESVANIRDLITGERPADIDTQIKSRILKIYAESDDKCLRRLLKGSISNERKPSQILYRIYNLNKFGCREPVLITIFLEILDARTRRALIATEYTSLQKLAEISDAMHAHDDGMAGISSASVSDPNYKELTCLLFSQIAINV